jgi:hypothetical protein
MGGWRATSADCREVVLDGGHFAFLGAPAALLAEITRDLPVDAGPGAEDHSGEPMSLDTIMGRYQAGR